MLNDDVKIEGRIKLCLLCKEEFIQEANPNEEFLCTSCQSEDSKVFTVGWVGHHKRKIKHFDLAKKAISELRGCELKVAGFMSLPHESMPEFYKTIDCLLFTSSTEAHPLPVYEALAMGVPVITTPVGDVLDTLISGQNAIIINENAEDSEHKQQETIEHIKNAVLYLKNNPEFRAKLTRNGVMMVRKHWAWEKLIVNYHNHFQHILEMNKVTKQKNIKIFIFIDVRNWALNITANGMIKYLNRYYPDKYKFVIMDKDDYQQRQKEFRKNVEECDIVFTCRYFPYFSPEKTTIKISGWEMLKGNPAKNESWLEKILKEFSYVNTPNFAILHELFINRRAIRKRTGRKLQVELCHLGSGVDLELFHR